MTHCPPAPNATPGDELNSEMELLGRLIHDDPLAWREFNSLYSRLIHRCISKVINRFSAVASPDDCLEIYSTLCLQLLAHDKRKLRAFDPSRGTKLSTYLGMLATHAAYDLLRRRRRTPFTETLDSTTPLRTNRSLQDEVCDARQQARQVLKLLSEFSQKDQQFVSLYYGEGLDPEVVAERMGITVKTVYSKKHKIRCRLEAMLAERVQAA
jgi:RNA polymerase sigma-70 factor (ECF subfamily)